MTWIMTATGRQIDFLTPDPANISLTDICIALSRNHRFGGHSPVKVGQHLLEVVTLMLQKAAAKHPGLSKVALAEIVLVGLLHDFPEYVVGDIPTPLKRLLGPEFATIEDRILQTMLRKWDLVGPYAQWNSLLKWADQEAVEQEATRFKLDGWVITDEFTAEKVPPLWVPENKVVTLRDRVWDEEMVCVVLSCVFCQAMILTGRQDLIGNGWLKIAEAEAAQEGLTVLDYVSQPQGIPPLLLSGESYL